MIKEVLPGGTSKGAERQDRGGEESGPVLGFRQSLDSASRRPWSSRMSQPSTRSSAAISSRHTSRTHFRSPWFLKPESSSYSCLPKRVRGPGLPKQSTRQPAEGPRQQQEASDEDRWLGPCPCPPRRDGHILSPFSLVAQFIPLQPR